MTYFIEVMLNGVLAGAIYALIGLAFVIVYKASRVINFALGEFLMIAARLVATGLYVFGLGLTGAIAFGCAGMVLLAVGFNWLVLRHLVSSQVVTLIMVTIGFGVVLRALSAVIFAGVPGMIPLPLSQQPMIIRGVLVSPDELVATALATASVAAVGWFFHRSRTGVALRALADDPQAAMLVGIDLNRHITLTWGLAGLIAVLAGTLGTFVTGGGFSTVQVSLKVFPIVMIGGLDSLGGVVIGAILVGLLENMAAAYLDPLISGFSLIASYLVLIVMLFVRPYGLFGEPDVERV